MYRARLRAWLVLTANSKANMGRWPVRTAHSTHSRRLLLPQRVQNAFATQGCRDRLQDHVLCADKGNTRARWEVSLAPCVGKARIQNNLVPVQFKCVKHVGRISTHPRAVTMRLTAGAIKVTGGNRVAPHARRECIMILCRGLTRVNSVHKASFTSCSLPYRSIAVRATEGIQENQATEYAQRARQENTHRLVRLMCAPIVLRATTTTSTRHGPVISVSRARCAATTCVSAVQE